MKSSILFTSVLVLIACSSKDDKKEETVSKKDQVVESRKHWEALKEEKGSSYSYSSSFSYEFDKKAWKTTLGVIDGQVACRKHSDLSKDENDAWVEINQFTENSDTGFVSELAAPALSVDQLYDQCLALVEKEPNEVTLNFKDGLLSLCITSCEGQCFDQVEIEDLSFEQPVCP